MVTKMRWATPSRIAGVAALTGLAVGCLYHGAHQIREPRDVYPEFTIEEQREAQEHLEARLRAERIENLRATTPPANWIAHPYHGLLLDANRDVIEVNLENVSLIQESMFEVLMGTYDLEQRPRNAEILQDLFSDPDLTVYDRLIARSAVICELLTDFPRHDYLWRHALVRGAVHELVDRRFDGAEAGLAARLRRSGISVPCISLPELDSEYVRECRSHQVPIPPDWPSADWISRGPLAITFISQGLSAEVFAYHDPSVPGACIALPRRNTSREIRLLGIICQSATTGKACFWDNIDAAGNKITGTSISLDIDTIQNGSSLAENCTTCHRGDNVFNIHPGTALQLPPPYVTTPQVRYEPIGQAHWSNPGPLALPFTGQCGACHGLADTTGSPSYCAILRDAATTTMPPPGGMSAAGWPAPTGSHYFPHIEFLRGRCP